MYYFLVAPGYVESTRPGGGSDKTAGTSFSAPIVSGTAALIAARWPKLKPYQIRDILLKTATDMGKKGVDKVYGRGRLNIKKALSPVRGKVGGVRIKKANVFNRMNSLASFRTEPVVYDAYGRDFQATTYNNPIQGVGHLLPLTNGTDPLWMNFSESLDSDGRELTVVDGFSLHGWRYQKNIKAVYDWTNFGSNGNSNDIPASVAYLNSGNSYYGYETEKFSVFISTNSEQTVNPTRPETVGITFKSDLGHGSMVTNTIGQIRENGFFGLNSEDDFGFDKEMKNFFFVSDLKKKYHDTEFHVRFENHSSPNSYNSRVMSWSDISLSRITFDIGHNWDNQRIGASVKSPMVASGQFKSKIRGLNSLSDFYHEDEAIQLSYKADLKRAGFLEVVASNDQKHSVKLSYGINF